MREVNEAVIVLCKCGERHKTYADFINAAFSTEEQSKIQITNVSADKNPKFDVDSGNATTDKVFLLNITEVEKYFPATNARKAGKYDANTGVNCQWWLRTSGYTFLYNSRNGSTLIGVTGAISYGGNSADMEKSVRPAMWISIK